MAVTRSGRSVGATAKKIKFLDDGEAHEKLKRAETQLPLSESELNVDSAQTQEGLVESGLEEDDSDEAPEEESLLHLKSALLQKMKEQAHLEQQLRKLEKEKRKQQDLHFKQQQEAKREAKREKIKHLVDAEKLPDLLPEEALESDDGDEDKEDSTNKGNTKHLRSDDFEKEDATLRKKMKLEKLKKLKEMRKQALKKGPVYVQVQLSTTFNNRVPKAEQVVLDTKTLWFQRESLHKK